MAFDPLTAILDIGGKLIDRIIPDPQQAATAKLELIKAQQAGDLAQLQADLQLATGQQDVNKIEASSTRLFVAGWRPFIGWVCGAAYAWNFIGLPAARFGMAAIGHPIAMEPLSLSELAPILLGLLGLGAMRTTEKVKGVA